MWEHQINANAVKVSDHHLLVDLLEITCLFDDDQKVALSEDVFEEIKSELEEDEDSEEVTESGEADVSGADVESDEQDENSAPYRVGRSIDIYGLEQQINGRIKWFNNNYPFKFDSAEKILSLKKRLTRKHYTYIFLLFATNSRIFNQDATKRQLRNDFELFTGFIMHALIPSWAKVRMFGTARSDSAHGSSPMDFDSYAASTSGGLKGRVEALARDLRVVANSTGLTTRNVGDIGIDCIGFFPLDDPADARPVFFAQAGTTYSRDEMHKKIALISPRMMESYFPGTSLYSLMVSPVSFRTFSWEWPVPAIAAIPLLDRYRILRVLRPKFFRLTDSPINSITEIEEMFATS
ncbi:MAG: hypothetical protein FVQ85_21815 [Planctomycetes bacterium]|nr:hypothetical protein [Planctomycetota bacterium]